MSNVREKDSDQCIETSEADKGGWSWWVRAIKIKKIKKICWVFESTEKTFVNNRKQGVC